MFRPWPFADADLRVFDAALSDNSRTLGVGSIVPGNRIRLPQASPRSGGSWGFLKF